MSGTPRDAFGGRGCWSWTKRQCCSPIRPGVRSWRTSRPARKYYLGLVTIWQKVGDLTGSEHGETILTNSDMKLLLKQSEEIIDAADARFRFTPVERRFLLGALKGEGLLSARGGRWPIKIEASPAEHRLATTNPRELAEVADMQSKRASLSLNGSRQGLNGTSSVAVGES